MSVIIEIINLRDEKPSAPYDVLVDRSTTFGNPFEMFVESNRDSVCDQYEEWFQNRIEKIDTIWNVEFKHKLAFFHWLLAKYGKLRLFCWCAPKRCHAETIRKHLLKEFKQ